MTETERKTNTGHLVKVFIILALVGFLSGLLIELFICLALSTKEEPFSEMPDLFMKLIGSGLYGAVVMGGTIVYHIESWGLWRVTISHYTLTLVSFLITNALLGWFSSDLLIVVLIIFTVAYMIIWFVEFLIWRHTVKKMNEDLEHMIRNGEEDTNL